MPLSEVLREWSEIYMHHNMREFKRFADEAGLSLSQISALSRLYFGGACGNSTIADHLGVTDAAASQMVERLVQRGLLLRTECADDRRARQLVITEEGRKLMEQSVAIRFRWMERLTQVLTEAQQERVAAGLELMIEAVSRLDREAADSQPLEPVQS